MEWETVETKTIHEDHWQTIQLKKIETPKGQMAEFMVVEKKGDGAVVIAVNKEGKIALVSIYRFAVNDRIWQLPVEHIELDEDAMQAATKACREELGCYPETIEKLGEYYVDPGTINYKAQVFLATQLEPLEDQQLEPVEHEMIREVRWLSPAEIDRMIAEREIRDSWTIGGMYLYTLKHKNTRT